MAYIFYDEVIYSFICDCHYCAVYMLNHFLEGFRGTGLRQTLFAEFERESHAMCEAGKIAGVDLSKPDIDAML